MSVFLLWNHETSVQVKPPVWFPEVCLIRCPGHAELCFSQFTPLWATVRNLCFDFESCLCLWSLYCTGLQWPILVSLPSELSVEENWFLVTIPLVVVCYCLTKKDLGLPACGACLLLELQIKKFYRLHQYLCSLFLNRGKFHYNYWVLTWVKHEVGLTHFND